MKRTLIIGIILIALIGSASAANILTDPSQFNATAWVKYYTGSMMVNDTTATTSPTGDYTADRIKFSGSATPENYYITQSANIIAGQTYEFTFDVKPYSSALYILQLTGGVTGFGPDQYANFNISSCAVVASTGGTATATNNGSGWCTIQWEVPAISTGTVTSPVLFSTGNNVSATRAPTYIASSSYLYLWGGGMENTTSSTPGGTDAWASFNPVTSDNKTVFGSATVQFDNTHTAISPTGYSWTFQNLTPGNNTVVVFSTAENPVHSFGVGNYAIALTVTNASGSNTTLTNSHFVNVTQWSQDGTTDLPILPANHILRVNISNTTTFPTKAQSATWTASMSAGGGYFKLYQGTTATGQGKKIMYVGTGVPSVPVVFTGIQTQSDVGQMFDWAEDGNWYDDVSTDGNLYTYNRDTGIGYEFSYVDSVSHPDGMYPNGTHGAGTGNIMNYANLTIHRPIGTSASSVSGIPRIPTLLTYADMASTDPIGHAMETSFGTVNAGGVSDVTWPASATTTIDGVNASWPKMGERARLNTTCVGAAAMSHLQTSHPDSYKIAIGLRDYGSILSIRSGVGMRVNSEVAVISDTDNSALQSAIPISCFEFVDESSMMVAANSYAAYGVAPEGGAPVAHFDMAIVTQTPTPTPTPTSTPEPIPDYGAPTSLFVSDPLHGISGTYALGGSYYGGGTQYPAYTAGVDAVVAGGTTYDGNTVTSKEELLAALTGASSGDVIYIDPSAEINMGSTTGLNVPENVTIASNRGVGGSAGGKIYTTTGVSGWNQPIFTITHNNVRFTGLQLSGERYAENTGGSQSYYRTGIRVNSATGFIIDNCDLGGFAYADVYLSGSPTTGRPWIHHNYINGSWNLNEGYGINVGDNGDVLIEGNVFDRNRHSVTSDGDAGDKFTVRYNYFPDTEYQVTGMSNVDAHGRPDGDEIDSGLTYEVYSNTFAGGSSSGVHQRGKPVGSMSIWKNIFNNWPSGAGWTSGNVPVYQSIPSGHPFGGMNISDNYVMGTWRSGYTGVLWNQTWNQTV